MKDFCKRTVNTKWFEYSIISLILINAAVLGLETSASINQKYTSLFTFINQFVLAIFVLEAVMKITAVYPKIGKYFRDGWNVFDFTIVVLSFVPATGQFAVIARLARLMRVLRLISALPELKLIVSTLIRSIPSMGNVVLLMSVIFYVYAILGFHLFHQHDPQHWGNLGVALLSLFRIATLEDWTDLMYAGMEMSPHAWIFFVSFVVIGTFVVINLFIAIIINNLDNAKAQALEELKSVPSRDDLIKELNEAEEALAKVQLRLREAFDLDSSTQKIRKVRI